MPNNIQNNNINKSDIFSIHNSQNVNINNNNDTDTFTNRNININIDNSNEDQIIENESFSELASQIFLNRIVGKHISYLFEEDDDDDSFFNNFGLRLIPISLVFTDSNGVDKKILNNLPKIIIDNETKLEQERCVICLEDYKKGDEIIKTPCSHVFHSKCIIEWFNNKNYCPICKFELKDDY